jgi:glycosyltransferase involved in cell wall biosynthesis
MKQVEKKPLVPLVPALSDSRLDRAGLRPPLVTVIVTSFNYAAYLPACLASVAAQTWTDFECLVVDDASTDGSLAVIEAFLASPEAAGRFRLIRHRENAGQMEAFKTGIAAARGAFVTMVDADDLLLDDFLETHLRVHMGRNPVAFTSSNQYQIDGDGRLLSAEHLDHLGKGRYRRVGGTTFQRGFWIWATTSSMMYRTAMLRLILDGQDTTFRICADYYIAHFANLLGASLLIPTIHGAYRRHGENHFGSNPVLGALNSVGSMAKHPPHAAFRRAMIDHILGHLDWFMPILGPIDLVKTLFKIGTWSEVAAAHRAHPEAVPGPLWKLCYRYWRFRLPKLRRQRIPWLDRLQVVEPELAEPGRPPQA